MSLKENQVDHELTKDQNQILKVHLRLNKHKINKPSPRHDTDITHSTDFKFWESQNLTTIKDQLNKRGFRKHKTPNGWK